MSLSHRYPFARALLQLYVRGCRYPVIQSYKNATLSDQLHRWLSSLSIFMASCLVDFAAPANFFEFKYIFSVHLPEVTTSLGSVSKPGLLVNSKHYYFYF
jgi:hypothetical protein